MAKPMTQMTLKELTANIGVYAANKGWNDKPRSFDEWIALFHTELSEAYEEYRNGRGLTDIYNNPDPHRSVQLTSGTIMQKPEGIPMELADEIIRILHFCSFAGIDIGAVIAIKMMYNEARPYRHGGKVS